MCKEHRVRIRRSHEGISSKDIYSCFSFFDKVYYTESQGAIEPIKDFFEIPSRTTYHMSSIPSATELDKVGIGFTTSLSDVSSGHRTLRLPQIYVDYATYSTLLNIIAFEQVYPYAEKEVSSYIYFMSRLLQGADDVRLLPLWGIIHGPLAADEVAELFRSLVKDTVHDPNDLLDSEFHDVARNLAESYNYKMNNPLQKDLWQNYLRNPLAIVSFVAGFLLFSLTTIQTVYIVLSYYNPK